MTWLPSHNLPKITLFSSWMEAWNVYLAIYIDHSPAWTPQLVAYQWIITSTGVQYPLAAWLNHDTQFRILAVSDPTLRWDNRHTDLWLQYVTSPYSAIRWPCSHCGAINHYPANCPFQRLHTVPTPTNESKPSTTGPTCGQQLITRGQPILRPATWHAFNC